MRRAVVVIVDEFGAADCPRLVWGHAEHPRTKPGGDEAHLHLVVGHFERSRRALHMERSVKRLEKVMRFLEVDCGEPPTLGRHHTAVIHALDKSRDDVADIFRGVRRATPTTTLARHQPPPHGRASMCRAYLRVSKRIVAPSRRSSTPRPTSETPDSRPFPAMPRKPSDPVMGAITATHGEAARATTTATEILSIITNGEAANDPVQILDAVLTGGVERGPALQRIEARLARIEAALPLSS